MFGRTTEDMFCLNFECLDLKKENAVFKDLKVKQEGNFFFKPMIFKVDQIDQIYILGGN
jgi:hypothetical protein